MGAGAPGPHHQIVAPVPTRTGAGMSDRDREVQIPIEQSSEHIKTRQIRPIPVQMVHSQGSILTETQAKNVNRQHRVKPPPQ